MATPEASCSWWLVLAPAVSWLLVIGGWIFVKKDNDRRQKLKEEREKINAIIDLVEKIEDLAQKYYSSKGTDIGTGDIARQICGLFNRLVNQLQLLKLINPLHDHDSDRISFWKTVTGGQFDTKTRTASKPSDLVFSEIGDAVSRLTGNLEKKYYNKKNL